jgi:Ca-activated chloride channel family protein
MKVCCKVVVLFALISSFNVGGAAQTASSKPPATSLQKSLEPVVLTTTVMNKKGEPVSGLRRDNFQVFIDKDPAEIVDFRQEDEPLSVGIIFDASGSVADQHSMKSLIKDLQQALRTFIDTSNQSNEYFVMAFNIRPQLLLDWTSDSRAIIDTLSVLQPKGNTALYDACYLAIDKVQHGRNSKRVLILVSDGEDNVSTYSFDQVRDELRVSDVLVYSINFSNTGFAGSALGTEGLEILNELSLVSGGTFFYKRNGRAITTSEANAIFELIARELRQQYTIAVAPHNSSDTGKWHKIRIKVGGAANARGEMKHFSARTREGFYLNQR